MRTRRLVLLALLLLPLAAGLASGCAARTTATGEKSLPSTQK